MTIGTPASLALTSAEMISREPLGEGTVTGFELRGVDSLPPSADLPDLPDGTVAYHALRGDFSRWIRGVLADHALAREVAHAERDLEAQRSAAVEDARVRIQQAVVRRYLSP